MRNTPPTLALPHKGGGDVLRLHNLPPPLRGRAGVGVTHASAIVGTRQDRPGEVLTAKRPDCLDCAEMAGQDRPGPAMTRSSRRNRAKIRLGRRGTKLPRLACVGTAATGEVLGAAHRDQLRTAHARAGAGDRSLRPARAGLWLVYRRVRDQRARIREASARRAEGEAPSRSRRWSGLSRKRREARQRRDGCGSTAGLIPGADRLDRLHFVSWSAKATAVRLMFCMGRA